MSEEEKFDLKDVQKDEDKPTKRTYYKIEKTKLFDIEENMMMSLLYNLKRADTLASARVYCESVGLDDISQERLIKIYNNARTKLFNRRLETVDEEKKKLVKCLYRLACKAEVRGDFANAYKSYNRIAELAGVDKDIDDSKVILNFVAAKPRKPAVAEEILEAEFRSAKEEKKDEQDT